MLIHKLKVKKENCSEVINQIRYNIKVEAVRTVKFYINFLQKK